jgi:hypothetical protein
MPRYIKVENDQFTIAANRAVYGWWITWEGQPGVGPNQGPLFVMADPKSHQSKEVHLVTYDLTKCRRDPSTGATEVFYEYGVRNDSAITATFDLEIIDFQDLMS